MHCNVVILRTFEYYEYILVYTRIYTQNLSKSCNFEKKNYFSRSESCTIISCQIEQKHCKKQQYYEYIQRLKICRRVAIGSVKGQEKTRRQVNLLQFWIWTSAIWRNLSNWFQQLSHFLCCLSIISLNWLK